MWAGSKMALVNRPPDVFKETALEAGINRADLNFSIKLDLGQFHGMVPWVGVVIRQEQ